MRIGNQLGMALAIVLCLEVSLPAQTPQPRQLLEQSQRIVFLGDSITASGIYIADFEAWLLTQKLPALPLVIDAGLSSETVSGLSEEGHAGGKFPRPDLFERLDRVLAVTKPDLVIACYGMNCGIYKPFDAERFAAYQQGITRLKAKAEAAGAKFIVMTPPMYDEHVPLPKPEAPGQFSYNGVLDRYSDWLLEQRTSGWNVVDLHHPMTRDVLKRREIDPKFTFQPDKVHPNPEGHWFIAQQLIRWFGDESVASSATPQAMLTAHGLPESVLPLVQQRMNLLRDAHVGTAGHKRPGVAPGLPIPEATEKATALTAKIREQLEARK